MDIPKSDARVRHYLRKSRLGGSKHRMSKHTLGCVGVSSACQRTHAGLGGSKLRISKHPSWVGWE
ncbi:hypothetical protein J6590_081344 [Homalodisca vitripennis]|nr:hypothetical protein J6590_081344 [Homalodisca vitripennis]